MSLRRLLASRSCSRCFCVARNAASARVVVAAENMRLLQHFHRRCIRIMCRVTLATTLGSIASRPGNWRRSRAPTTSDAMMRYYVHSSLRALRYLGNVFRMDADRTPSLLQRCWVVDGKQPSGKTKDLYDSAVQKLFGELGLSLLDASNKSEWHNITRPEALAASAAS